MKVCVQCGQQLSDDALYCSRCGAELATGFMPQRKRKSRAWIVVLVLAGLFVLVIPIVLIIAAIAIPNLIRARIAANQSSAIAGVRRIMVSLAVYEQQHQQYAATLADLGADGQLPADLAGGQRNGYRFTYAAEDTDGNGTLDVYVVHADPLVEDRTGVRHYFGDQTGVVRQSPEFFPLPLPRRTALASYKAAALPNSYSWRTIMPKNHFIRSLIILALVGVIGLWSSAQTKPKPAPKQNPNSAVAADESATEKRSGISDTVDIVEGPRVEADKNSAVLEWKTNKEAATRVQYGTTQNQLTQHAYEPGGAREHKITIRNLKPGTTYFYTIENRSGKQRYDGQFQTKQ